MVQKLGAFDEAYACYRRAIELDPNSIEAYQNIGAVLRERGVVTAAADAFQNALLISPTFAEARYNLAMTKQGQGHLAEALVDYRVMIESDPKDGRGYYGTLLRPFAKKLTGVDLSPGMLKKKLSTTNLSKRS